MFLIGTLRVFQVWRCSVWQSCASCSPPSNAPAPSSCSRREVFFFWGGVGGFGRWFCVVFCLFGCFFVMLFWFVGMVFGFFGDVLDVFWVFIFRAEEESHSILGEPVGYISCGCSWIHNYHIRCFFQKAGIPCFSAERGSRPIRGHLFGQKSALVCVSL